MWNDIFQHPGNYLNGTAPLNLTGTIKTCVYEIGPSTENNCTYVPVGPDRDSYLWYVVFVSLFIVLGVDILRLGMTNSMPVSRPIVTLPGTLRISSKAKEVPGSTGCRNEDKVGLEKPTVRD